MKVIIKELDNDCENIDKVQKFLFEQIKKEFGYGYVPEWHEDIIKLGKYYVNPIRNNFFVAYCEETGEIIATIGIRAYDKDFPEFRGIYSKNTTSSIWRLFVDRKYRRCGLATKLYNVAEEFCYENNFNEIYLHTHKNLEAGFSFWKKVGFNVTWDTNNELQTVHMVKNLCSK